MIATSWLAPDSCQNIQDTAVQEACDARLNWPEYLHLVDRHRTPATSWAALKRTPRVHVPEQVKRELQRRSDLCRWQAMIHLQLLAEVLKPLNQSGIPVMPLKGPLLSLALYEDVGLRQSKDLDILVPQGEIRRAQECVENLGWHLGAEYFPLSPRQWKAVFLHEWHIGYVHPQQDGELELHWRWSSTQKTEQYWTRSRTIEMSGFCYRAMSLTDLVIYLSDHGAKHRWFRAKWVGDLARLHCSGQVDWTDVLARASTMGQEQPVLLGLHLLSECYDLALPNVPRSISKRLPYLLSCEAVRAFTPCSEPNKRNVWVRVKERVETYRYNRELWRHRSWWSRATYCRLDFKILRLPDSLFWLYTPLRPFLWLWRRVGAGLRGRIRELRKKISEALSAMMLEDRKDGGSSKTVDPASRP